MVEHSFGMRMEVMLMSHFVISKDVLLVIINQMTMEEPSNHKVQLYLETI